MAFKLFNWTGAMYPNRKTQRDANLVRDAKSGVSIAELERRYGIGGHRCRQIIRAAQGKTALTSGEQK